MNLEQIEKLITLVKENDVKKFRYKDYSSEIDIDFCFYFCSDAKIKNYLICLQSRFKVKIA